MADLFAGLISSKTRIGLLAPTREEFEDFLPALRARPHLLVWEGRGSGSDTKGLDNDTNRASYGGYNQKRRPMP